MAAESGSWQPPALDGHSRQQLSEHVATVVRGAVMAGDLRGGEFVRTEQLADRLQVSATPVREALMLLHSEGVVRWEPRRGFRVVPVTRRDVTDLFEVAAFISGELAARAAGLLTADDVAELERLQRELDAAARRGGSDEVFRINHRIHRAVHRPGMSNRLASQLRTTLRYVPRRYYGEVPGWVQASTDDHAAIFAGLRERDAGAARAAMAGHMRHVGRLLVDHLEGLGAFETRGAGSPPGGPAAPGAGRGR